MGHVDGYVVRDPATGNVYAALPENVGDAKVLRPLRPNETVASFQHKPGLAPLTATKEK